MQSFRVTFLIRGRQVQLHGRGLGECDHGAGFVDFFEVQGGDDCGGGLVEVVTTQ